jgi:cell division protein FtsZ
MEFDLPKETSSIIKVIGVGGGGSNAVNHMYGQGIIGVDFIVCNTDRQALDISPVPYKIQLGSSLTEGRGAGAIPEIGMNAAIENIDEIKEVLSKNTKMVFVTAGMGGGTGTGAAPVIAQAAKDMGILTVGIVTVPFNFEGRKRRQQAEEGMERMRQNVDTLLVINNERLREITGNLTLGNAFAQADDVLTTAAKGIAEVISVTGAINVDFNDVKTVMKDSGVAIMGSAAAEGENRATVAVQQALSSPLLNDNDISGAQYVLLNITYGDKEVLMDEITEITDFIQDEAGATADVIWGHGYDPTLGDKLSVTLIATGFKSNPITGFEKAPEKTVRTLEEEPKN